jgi:hypothetical protein
VSESGILDKDLKISVLTEVISTIQAPFFISVAHLFMTETVDLIGTQIITTSAFLTHWAKVLQVVILVLLTFKSRSIFAENFRLS